jgi:hypothetical protein
VLKITEKKEMKASDIKYNYYLLSYSETILIKTDLIWPGLKA